jgi:alanine racemase
MSEKRLLDSLRTWIEIDSRSARSNYNIFRKIIGKKVLLWAVVKSNAYGHGLVVFSKLMEKFGIDGFCVDSVVEGIALRKVGIKKFILVLGSTLPERFEEAAQNDITISISNFESFKKLSQTKNCPNFHIKIDTGMHRQGFYIEDIPDLIKKIKKSNLQIQKSFKGIFTHFASAKDINYPTYTDLQFEKIQKAKDLFIKAGFKNLIVHSSATGGTLINKKYHCDAVRIGIGLYGMWPSKELEMQLGDKIKLKPILSWRAVVSEIKKLKAGDYIGYDLAERVHCSMNSIVLPVGYWHGLYRSLSSFGEVIINGKRARFLGRVSMDMISVGTKYSARQGDIATLIGKDGKDEIFAWELAQKAGTSHYEIVTRLNPLIERIVV